MHTLVLIAGFGASFVVLGHFMFGIKWYLKPMLKSDFDVIPKATMHCVFHYISIFLVLTALILLGIGMGKISLDNNACLVKFIGLNYLGFAFVQIIYSIKSKVENPLISMFQWTLFVPIGILCILGS